MTGKFLSNYHIILILRERNNIMNNYTCQFCGLQFLLKGKFHRHLKTHNSKPFQCGYCLKGFTETHYRKIHMLSACKKRPSGKCYFLVFKFLDIKSKFFNNNYFVFFSFSYYSTMGIP